MTTAHIHFSFYTRLILPCVDITNNIKKDLARKLSFMYRAEGNIDLIDNRSKLEAIIAYHYSSLNEISEYARLIEKAYQGDLSYFYQDKLSSLQKNVVEIVAINKRILEIAQNCLNKIKRSKREVN